MSDSTNPKDLLGVLKAPLGMVPPALLIEVAPAMAEGARKYGAFNWREKDVRAHIYYEAMLRHLAAWYDGEQRAADSGVKHLGHVGACIAILLDAEANGNLIDDRPAKGPAAALLAAQDRTGISAPVEAPRPSAARTFARVVREPEPMGYGDPPGAGEWGDLTRTDLFEGVREKLDATPTGGVAWPEPLHPWDNPELGGEG